MTEDKLAQLMAAAAHQLRGQNDTTAEMLAAHSARVGDPAVRKDIARQVSNLYSGIGGLGGTVVRREGVADAEATRALDKTLQELREVVTDELNPPIVELRKVVDARRLLVRHREIPGVGLRSDFVAKPSVTPGPVSTGPGTLVMEFPVARPVGGTPTPLTRLTFVGVAEHTFLAEGFVSGASAKTPAADSG